MSKTRSLSPARRSEWVTQELGTEYEEDKEVKMNGRTHRKVSWDSTQARSARVNGATSMPNGKAGFFGKHMRRLSESLPQFTSGSHREYVEKEKYGTLGSTLIRFLSRARRQFGLVALILFALGLLWLSPLHNLYNHTSFLGGGSKFVLILAANQGGGVMEWKGPKEWAIERDSVRNKRKYVKKWGYDIEIVDMATKKRYAHEWRESWEKVDTLKRCMHDYPDAEWFWWLDLNTFIMEPSYSLQNHIFNDLAENTYRDINHFNPLNITHPPTDPWLDEITRSAVGDGKESSINMVLPQDCGGFNLGSFFIRRSAWTDRLLDIWWDPVHYEQRHMQWEHKEQDAFEYLYTSQPWIRPHTAFIPQRKACSYPPGACGENNTSIHYNETDRDFVVNMAGCEWGRDCWGEMYNYRELSNRLNRSRWEKFKTWLAKSAQSTKRRIDGEKKEEVEKTETKKD